MKPAKLSTKNVLIVCAAAAVASSLLIPTTGKPKAVTPPIVAPRDIKQVETIAFEVDSNGYVLGGIVVPAIWTAQDAAKHCQATNQYVIWKSDTTTPQPGRGWKYDGQKIVPVQPYPTWTLDDRTLQWISDVPQPADAGAKLYGYVNPDEAKGETKGSWTDDPQKVSPPETGPPLDPQSYPKKVGIDFKTPHYFYASQRDTQYWQFQCTTCSAEWTLSAGGGGAMVGGGGAGGLLDGTGANAKTITSGTGYPVTIGAGGAGHALGANGSNGSDSVFDTGTAKGGGGGGETNGANGSDGGSGGGASGSVARTGGAATQGNSGGGTGYGNAGADNTSTGQFPGSGGGGANAAGAVQPNGTVGGAGGAGKAFFGASNASTTYSGGGGGGFYGNSGVTGGAGGAGGGGAGTPGTGNGNAGTANTGGGGGGCGSAGGGSTVGGAGGSGVLPLRTSQSDGVTWSIGSASTGGGFDVNIITASGTATPTISGSGVNHNGDFFQLFGYCPNRDLWDRTYLRAA